MNKEIDIEVFNSMYENVSYFVPNSIIKKDVKELSNYFTTQFVITMMINDLKKQGV